MYNSCMKILAIETSCDETAVAIVENGVREIVSTVSSSAELHGKYGGVVPEIAARKQLEYIIPVILEVLEKSALKVPKDIDALAVTVGPGLIGSLVVGVAAAKSLSLAWNKPLIPVNHLVGHIYANWIQHYDLKEVAKSLPKLPAVVLVVSGGHTDLVLMRNHGDFDYLGGTRDDAAGESFDKAARLLGLGRYLGGQKLSEKASECKENTLRGQLPRPMMDQENYDFSFSGLKTAVWRLVEKEKYPIDVVACEFETAICDVLVAKTMKAARDFGVKSILLGGGVAANIRLRSRLEVETEKLGLSLYLPIPKLCTDNAVYIASAGYFCGKEKPLDKIQANPSLGILDLG